MKEGIVLRKAKNATLLLILASVSAGYARAGEAVSPALTRFPTELLAAIDRCVVGTAAYSNPTEQAAAWFRAFHDRKFVRALGEAESTRPGDYGALNRLYGTVDEVRYLVDFRTEQPLVAMVDAATREGRRKDAQCRVDVARFVLRVGAQRDRAWAWAGVMQRRFAIVERVWEPLSATKDMDMDVDRLERSWEALERFAAERFPLDGVDTP